jgi:deoxyribodipyrimidine photo-lyase
MKTAIWWIRRDLRLADNVALQAAISSSDQVIPVFILDPILLDSDYVGQKRRTFLYENIKCLDESLRNFGSRLILQRGEPGSVLEQLTHQFDHSVIFAESDISPYAVKRDQSVEKRLPIQWVGYPTIHPPGTILKPDGNPYRVFSSFNKTFRKLPFPTEFEQWYPTEINTPDGIQSLPIPQIPNAAHSIRFVPGESAALEQLAYFCEGTDAPIYRYGLQRDLFSEEGTSKLSPYLKFGIISVRRAAAAAFHARERAPNQAAYESADSWLNELIWREFFQHILFLYPHARKQSFREEYRDIQWGNDPELFEAWCQGQTGYPVIDAAMRQLSREGWLHNRLRMVVASFLTKDLHIDWRWGERWFMQHLVDGDPASNNGGWQWTAGTGTDAAPYFRIFNPVTQSKKYDPDGVYIRRWVPELDNVPNAYIHSPWEMPVQIQAETTCRIGVDYPVPVVDHRVVRQKTLDIYAAARDDR